MATTLHMGLPKARCIFAAFLAHSVLQARAGTDACHGFDEMWGVCPDLPSCEECTPVNCEFSEWGEWYDSFGKCTGLRFRERTLKTANNECGKPCSGSKIESAEQVPEECLVKPVDCAMSDWSKWSECKAEVGQIYRKREVLTSPTEGGAVCSGSTEETRPCGKGPAPEPCVFSEWQEWTACSATCGDGRHTRMRRVLSEARHSGDTCKGNTLETAPCSIKECGGTDCSLGEWGEWSMCDAEGHAQRYRRREVLQAATGIGKRCNQTLKETQGCPEVPEEHCKISEWTEWSALGWREPNPPACNKECGGGQSFRIRTMESPPSHGGSCPDSSLKELKACNTQPCNMPCELSDWSEWATCSANCGKGTTTRKRSLLNPQAHYSEGCQGALAEALPCLGTAGECQHTDCQWSEWYEWSECTASCGGGMAHRSRMIKAMPKGGGAACEALTKSEAAPCNTQSCDVCIDAKWTEWQEWEACTATCNSAFAIRRRSIALEANSCGKPLSGVRHEYKVCSHLPSCTIDKDCEVSEWSAWSDCSSTCYGVQERNRYIKTFPSGNGAHCDMRSLKEMAPCNPGPGMDAVGECKLPGPSDCSMGAWSEWTACSKSCGGGQRERRRKVLELPKHGGRSCDGELTAVGPCSPQACEAELCTDCRWGMWSEWGDCTKCQGEKYRHRSIEQMPNHCGKMCDLQSAKEVTKCTGHCEAELVCAWTEWSTPSGCAGCGHGTSMRSRALSLKPAGGDFLFLASGDAKCLGAQLNMSDCPNMEPCSPPCVPEDCTFSEWGPWSQPASTGLCARHRNIASLNNKCGKPCSGAMAETMRCAVAADHDRRDCQLSDWGAWSDCEMNGKVGQRQRERYIVQQPSFDGQPCQATLHETQQCRAFEPVDCVLSQWAEWTVCAKSCEGGLQTRNRKIVSDAEHGGRLCEDSLHEMRMCNIFACDDPKQDCTYADWSSWSGCGADNQRYRERKVSQFAIGKGKACEGDLEETQPCFTTEKVDCVVSEWTTWDSCDKSCGGGQTQRQRQIMVFPESGGAACPGELLQTSGCNKNQCSVQDCQVSDWQEWSACSASCGPAHRQRQRKVMHLRNPGGTGCSLELSELAACPTQACPKDDCQWGEWQEWSGCPVSCGGGQQRRTREIAKMPQRGGKMCQPMDKEEVKACNSKACVLPPCQDGLWAEWKTWSVCSTSCGGGTSFRTREVAQMADHCGEPVSGNSHETRVCNAEIDCEPSLDCMFGDWGVWSACSQTCNGIMKRSRRIQQYGSGKGAYCNGHLKETSPCNPTLAEATPAACADDPPVDCELGEWSAWGDCSASCGGGEQSRSREVTRAPANGGKACDGAITLARQCGAERCPGPAPIDCEYGEWQDWGACGKCDGERRRFRHVLHYAENGGRACEPFEAEEASACPRQCHEKQYCSWGEWASWGDCSAKCGEGKRMRRRYLGLTTVPAAPPAPLTEMMKKYADLQQQTQSLRVSNKQELFLAFSGGFLSFVVAMVGVRIFVTLRSGSRATRSLRSSSVGSHSEFAHTNHLQESQATEPLVTSA